MSLNYPEEEIREASKVFINIEIAYKIA